MGFLIKTCSKAIELQWPRNNFAWMPLKSPWHIKLYPGSRHCWPLRVPTARVLRGPDHQGEPGQATGGGQVPGTRQVGGVLQSWTRLRQLWINPKWAKNSVLTAIFLPPMQGIEFLRRVTHLILIYYEAWTIYRMPIIVVMHQNKTLILGVNPYWFRPPALAVASSIALWGNREPPRKSSGDWHRDRV